jgi:Ca2+-binding RTX toxin-like protein
VGRSYGLFSDHSITRSPLESNVLFAVALLGSGYQAFESDDAGASWTSLAMGGIVGRGAFITVSPVYSPGGVQSFDVYASDGIDLHRQTCVATAGGATSCTSGGWTYINLRPGCAGQGPGCGGTPDTCPEMGGPCAHNDVSDLVFDPTGATCGGGRPQPLYLAGDGGIEVTTDCGISWNVVGGGAGGFGALQVFQMTGQVHASGVPTYFYFGTQDNDVWVSPDGGSAWTRQVPFEGYDLETPHFRSSVATGLAITGVRCGTCFPFARNADLSAEQPITVPPASHRSCPDTDTNGLCDAAIPPCMLVGGNQQCQAGCIDNDSDTTCDGVPCQDTNADTFCEGAGTPTLQLRTPKVVTDGVYLQFSAQTTFNLAGLRQAHLYLSNDFGASWNLIPGANVPATTLTQGTNLVAGLSTDPTFYTIANNQVLRVRSLLGPGNTPGTANVADVTPPAGLGTVGYYGVSTFIRAPFPAIGADPKNGNRVIAALSNGTVVSTTTGGDTWTTTGGAAELAQLSTVNGTFAPSNSIVGLGQFGIPANIVQSQIFSIGFDPSSSTVLAGTLNAGVLVSQDDGNSWARVCGTNVIPRVTSFFFDEGSTTAYASSFGRGLWSIDETQRHVPEFTTPPPDVNANDCRVDIGQAVAVDTCEGLPVTVVPDPGAAPGSPTFGCQNPAIRPCGNFPIGSSTTITWVATDSAGGQSTSTSTVSVGADTTGPAFSVGPPDLTTTRCTGVSLGQAAAADSCGGGVTITNDAPSKFPLGVTTVTWTARDDRNNVTTATQRVTVLLGDDAACCPAGTNIIQGTSNNDTLNGTFGSDCILGRGAQDIINGGGGNDFISGGDGNDSISGGGGNDMVFAGSGQDVVNGNGGADTLYGGDGDDQLFGGSGNDALWGGQGQDVLQGQDGNDQLFGEHGDDNLQGGAGDDSHAGGPNAAGHDTCTDAIGTNTFAQCQFGGGADSCADGVVNGTETGLDCGGGCVQCQAASSAGS